MNLRYRLHRLTGQLERRCYAVSALSNSGIALGPFNTGGDDLGVAVWEMPYEGRSSSPSQFLVAPGVSIFAVNDAGQFVGHQLKGGGEKAILGAVTASAMPLPPTSEKTSPISLNIHSLRRASAAYGLNTCGDYVGFRKKKDAPVAYICCSTGEFTDLEGPDEALNGYYAAAINDHGEIVGTALDRPSVLVWTRTGKLVSSKAVDFGQPLKINNAGQILCSYGIIDGETEFWVPAAPRCTDFTATDINNLGHAVGSGRPLDRHGQNEACLWGPDSTCWSLNDLIDNESVHLRRATAINDAGWIAADSYLLEPIAES